MADFFYAIYEWFESWTSNMLLNSGSLPLVLGITTFAITLATLVVFYYLINSTRWWGRTPGWFITMGINSVIALFVGLGMALSERTSKDITDIECWGLGFANMVVAMIAFVIFTFIVKWWSNNAKNVPF